MIGYTRQVRVTAGRVSVSQERGLGGSQRTLVSEGDHDILQRCFGWPTFPVNSKQLLLLRNYGRGRPVGLCSNRSVYTVFLWSTAGCGRKDDGFMQIRLHDLMLSIGDHPQHDAPVTTAMSRSNISLLLFKRWGRTERSHNMTKIITVTE